MLDKEKSMFDEMREQGSKLPDMVEHLQANGWQAFEHHDNWVRKEWTIEEKKKSLLDTHQAYKRCLENNNKPPVIDLKETVFIALGEASTCWEKLDDAGEFQSSRANDIGLRLMEKIEANIPNAVTCLGKAFEKDSDFYFAYQSNIAMPFVDAFNQYNLPSNSISQEMLKDIANIAAKQFLDLFIRESKKSL